MNISIIVLLYLVLVNLIAFSLMGSDKRKAKKKSSRIAEKDLFMWAIVGGSLGAIAGMYHYRHKTRHVSFRLGLPLILILQLYFFGDAILGMIVGILK